YIGDDHDGRRTGEDDGFPVERHDQAHAKYGARNDVGEHHQQVHDAGHLAPFAHQDVGDQHAKYYDEYNGDGGKVVGVGDVGRQRVEYLLVVVQSKPADKTGEISLDEGRHDDRQLRQQTQESY